MEGRESRDDVLGRQVGRYHVTSHLATGGMSELYIARQEAVGGFEKDIVLKVLQARYAQHPRVVGMFLDEARLSAKLNHPSIVHVYDVAEADGMKFIAMEYIHGETLTDIIKRAVEVGTFPPTEFAIDIISQVAAGLDYAHRRQDAAGGLVRIVHRDVSPSNIMVSYEGQTKIIDFGIARVQDQIREESGMHPGKASYMSPEQVGGEPVDYRSDIFSLGIILYETTVARRLWRGPPEEVMRRIVSEAIAPPTTIRQDYPAGLEAIVMKALEKRPADRYQSAEEMRHDLEEFVAAVGYRTGARRVSLYLRELFPIKAALSDEGIIQPRLAGDGDSAPLPLVGLDPPPGALDAGGSRTTGALAAVPSSGPLVPPASPFPPGMTVSINAHSSGAPPPLVAPRGPSNAKLGLFAALITFAGITAAVLLGRSSRPDGAVAAPPRVAENPGPGVAGANAEGAPPTRPAPSPNAPAEASPTVAVSVSPPSFEGPVRLTAPGRGGGSSASERSRNRRQRRQPNALESSARAGAPAPTPAAPAAPSLAPPPPAPEPPRVSSSPPEPVVARPAPPPPAARVVPDRPAAPAAPPGFVDSKSVTRVVREHAAEVQACFDRALMERADLRGRLTVRATIDPGGRVLAVAPTAVMEGGGRLQSCVMAAFQSWTFPSPTGGVKGTVTYSFSFE